MLTVDVARVAEYTLNHEHWAIPRAIIRDVFTPHARVAVKACHASSKTFTLADCVLMALLLRGDVITTAPTWEQVQTVLWGQVRRAIMDSRIPVREWGSVNLTDITLATGEKAVGLSTNEGVRFQGWHARPGSFLLIIVDEALGVRPDIFEAIEGIAAGGDVRIVLAGNPTAPGGYFYELFASESPLWQRYTIDAFATPNLEGLTLPELLALPEHALDDNPRGYLVTRRWVRDRYVEWGVDHPEWQSRVRGEFPQNADVSLIWQSWIDQASYRPAAYDERGGPLVVGIDVAGPGEAETVAVIRQGHALLDQRAWSDPDPRGAVIAWLRGWAHRGIERVNVDSAGIGHYFIAALRDADLGLRINPVNVGAAPQDPERYSNRKAELYWALRERFRDGSIAGVTDNLLKRQLASIQYKHDPRGRVVIESKDEAARRGIVSPDRAEALMLACAPLSPAQELAAAFVHASQPRPTPQAVDPFIRATQPERRWRRR